MERRRTDDVLAREGMAQLKKASNSESQVVSESLLPLLDIFFHIRIRSRNCLPLSWNKYDGQKTRLQLQQKEKQAKNQ